MFKIAHFISSLISATPEHGEHLVACSLTGQSNRLIKAGWGVGGVGGGGR